MTEKNEPINIYTDGGARPNPGNGGWGFCAIVNDKEEYHGFGGCGILATNNTAELVAVLEAVRFAVSKEWPEVIIHTDSKNTQRAFNNLNNYAKNGYRRQDGEPLKNQQTYIELYELLKDSGCKVTVEWVKGHSGVHGNEVADKLALRGIFCQMNGDSGTHVEHVDVTRKTPKASEMPEDLHPLLTGKRLYFKTNLSGKLGENCWLYASLTYPKYNVDKKRIPNKIDRMKMENKMAGMRDADNHYGILLTKNAIGVLEELKGHFDNLFHTRQAPCLIFLDQLRYKAHWLELNKSVGRYVGFKQNVLINSHSAPFGYVVDPPRKIFSNDKWVDFAIALYDRMKSGDKSLELVDITEEIFQKEEKGKKVKKVIWKVNDNIKSTDLAVYINHKDEDGREFNVQLNLGVDIPRRDQLARMTKAFETPPKATLILWDIDVISYRCGIIMEVDGDVLISFTNDANYRINVDKR